jgi:Flp pilus assembly protein TadG
MYMVHQGDTIMITKTSEKGQALVLITLAAIGLFAFAALAIDSSRAYSNKRHAQNAADTAALAGALAYAREGNTNNIETAALARAATNGYKNIVGDPSTVVTVTVTDVPNPADCPGKAKGKDITVTIESYIHATFARIIGRDTLASGATATARACGFKFVPLFDGHAIVGLNDTMSPSCALAFDTGNSSSVTWRVEGGGVFSNSCAFSKDNDTVTFDPGLCVSMPPGGVASGDWDCTPQPGTGYDWNDYVLANMPPNPCDGTPGDVGIWPSDYDPNFSNGVYCISNLDAYDSKDISLNNATLYVLDDDFSLKFAGGGGFFGMATKAGTYTGSDDYADYYMVVEPAEFCEKFSDNTNAQVIEWRGNGTGTFYGTVFAPSACLDLRGNGSAEGMHSQIIGWIVGSNGTADTYINYKKEENHQVPISPNISILE